MHLRLPGDDGDTIFAALKLLVGDEWPYMDCDLNATIFPCFHGEAAYEQREITERE